MNKKLKRSISAALVCAMMLTTTATALNVSAYADSTSVSENAGKSYTIRKKTVDAYYWIVDQKETTDLYFINGTDVAYMEINDIVGCINDFNGNNPKFKLRIKANGDKITLIRENGYKCIIDFAKDTIYFQDYNEFVKNDDSENLIDEVTLPERDENGKRIYLKKVSAGTNERHGAAITLDLAAYGIDLVRKGDKYYIPLQTCRDVLMNNNYPLFLFNGKAMFAVVPEIDGLVDGDYNKTSLGEIFYNGKTNGRISKEFAEFNYNELCLALDISYGFKETHNISTFDELMTGTGLKKMMLSGDPAKIDTALYTLCTKYLDDGHTMYGSPGYSTDYKFAKGMIKKNGEGPAREDLFAAWDIHRNARGKYYPDAVPGYEEVGDTAFITFDIFKENIPDVDYYKTAPTADGDDTIALVAYSVQQILRKNSPIKNVVIDLSCNIGGAVNAAVYTIAAFLGKARLSYENVFTGAVWTNEYVVDTNFDHKFDSKDYLAGKGLNLYCLESEVSFSSSNLVVCMFKQSPEVSLIGQTSGGGAGGIMWVGTAAGSVISVSNASIINFLKNGAIYDSDRGADPDIYFSKLDSYYDRKGLVEFIHELK